VASKAGGDTRTQPWMPGSLILQRIAQNVARLFLHAAAVPGRTSFKSLFHLVFQVANYELCHLSSLYDIMISQTCEAVQVDGRRAGRGLCGE
jgi:hypothetical protein